VLLTNGCSRFSERADGLSGRHSERFPGKSHFTVFECFDGSLLEYFRTATGITSEPPEKPTRTIMEVIEDIWRTETGTTTFRCLVRRLQRINKQMAGKARERFGDSAWRALWPLRAAFRV
jgi:type I restriction enzyme R subunit